MLLAMDDYASCRQINPALTKASLKHGLYYFQNWYAIINNIFTFDNYDGISEWQCEVCLCKRVNEKKIETVREWEMGSHSID